MPCHISGAVCESSIIPFLVPHHKVCLKTSAQCHAATLPKYKNSRLGCKVNFAPGKIPSGDKSSRKCIYTVPAQEMAKHRAKSGWLLLSNVGAVTCWNLLGCPKLPNWPQPLVGQSSPYCDNMWRTGRRYCCLTSFFPIVDICLNCEDIANSYLVGV